ncbi:MAG: dual specificity protein phosphatase family protein [Planctomycetes bacterium]|nr:dual specificity protein phosphatase family protein [Planctomycetota bacterium]
MKKTLLRIVVRLAYYPSLIFNRGMCLIGVWRRWDRIDEHLIIGAKPSRSDIAKLKELGVGAVVNMCREFDGHKDEMAACQVTQLYLPTLDFHSPTEEDMLRGVEFMQQQAKAGKSIYVHCKAGRGRSVTLGVCYLVAAHRIGGQEAYDRIREIRPQIDRGIVQRECVHAVERAVADGKLASA